MPKAFKVKVLLVDDNENNLMSMKSIFSEDNYDIQTANSGKQALKILLREFDFAIILMDVEMPNLNGFETASLIYEREKLKHIPIIFITAHGHGDENIFRGYRAGAVDYIYKPIRPELLKAKVQVFVELYKKNYLLVQQEMKLLATNRNLEIEIKERIASEEKIRELNKKLLENIDELEAKNKELDCFAYMASHDLQEPLRKIRIFSDRVSSKYAQDLDSESKVYIDKIQAACARMQNLISDIFTLSKISTTKEDLRETNMNTLLEEVIAESDLQIHESNAEIIIDKLPSLQVNKSLIKRLFQNLLANSIKYSKKDERPQIRISSKIETMQLGNTIPTKFCRIYFKDNGIGFEQQYAEQIFTMFKRLHANTEYEGTGIGLAICKKIVEEHQGFISAKSEVGAGTTFTISLPVDVKVRMTMDQVTEDQETP
ncbi:MAG: response regulator receiver sensor signal transduction histidine kinase [Bacteroidota bacterium]|jgi:signal transduction histidine kinase|nr:response regulator receiver sensor signal transduction histidine kinase [Bacteroidota bacterium]